jgi:holo-[acyl-carrier protein] synthase
MSVRIGLDVVDVPRLRRMLTRWDDRLVHRTLTPREAAYCTGKRDPAPHVAGTIAAKEALFKTLSMAPRWLEVEVVRLAGGQPTLALSGSAASSADRCGISHLEVSITHTRELAAAVVVGTARVDTGEG